MTRIDEDLHDLLLYAEGFVTAMVLYTRARDNRTVHIIDHDESAVDREDWR